MRFIGRSLLCIILATLPRNAAAQGDLPVRLDPVVVREAAPPKTLRPTEQLIQGKLVDESTGLPIARGNIELWAVGDTVRYYVNHKLVNEGTGSSLTKGRILFQSEGAEVYFKTMELRPVLNR